LTGGIEADEAIAIAGLRTRRGADTLSILYCSLFFIVLYSLLFVVPYYSFFLCGTMTQTTEGLP
jgi:hypothetical protein